MSPNLNKSIDLCTLHYPKQDHKTKRPQKCFLIILKQSHRPRIKHFSLISKADIKATKKESVHKFLFKMKFYLIFLFLFSFCELGVPVQDFKNQLLQKAFFKISKALTQQNHLLTVVIDSSLRSNIDSIPFAATAEIPHVIARLPENWNNSFTLNSSAIVSLDSIKSLKKFNALAKLHSTFTTRQQLFIYCKDGSVDQLAKIRNDVRSKKPLKFEYFVVEEEKSIRLLTNVWFTPERCYVP